jgi:hypothetical protein
MRVQQRVEGEEERLSTEELHALRARLFGETSREPKSIATVADLAEVLGRSPEEVWQQLDRLRAEKAFAVAPPKKASQLPLLGVAVVLLGAAYGIYKVTPRKLTEAEIDQQLAEAQRKRASRPKKIRYPIVANNPSFGAVTPGFSSQFEGVLTQTRFQPSSPTIPVSYEETVRRLKEELRREYADARHREAEAPAPARPLAAPKEPWNPQPTRDQFMLTVTSGNQSTRVAISTDPSVAEGQLDGLVNSLANNMRITQERYLAQRPESGQAPAFPPGFSMVISMGTSMRSTGGVPIAMTPIDPIPVRKKLEAMLREQIRLAQEPPEHYPGILQPFKKELALTVRLAGPLEPIEATLPISAGGKFKTGAEAMREFERGLKGMLDRAERQLRDVNAGKG